MTLVLETEHLFPQNSYVEALYLNEIVWRWKLGSN